MTREYIETKSGLLVPELDLPFVEGPIAGGWISMFVNANMLTMPPEDRALVFSLADAIQALNQEAPADAPADKPAPEPDDVRSDLANDGLGAGGDRPMALHPRDVSEPMQATIPPPPGSIARERPHPATANAPVAAPMLPPETPEAVAAHAHRWQLDAPSGPLVHGVCACGESKDWPASPDDSPASRTLASKRRPRTACKQCGRLVVGDKHGYWCANCNLNVETVSP